MNKDMENEKLRGLLRECLDEGSIDNVMGLGWVSAVRAALYQQEAEPVCRDWTEDFSHENGNYLCLCCQCGKQFAGHKRRVVCKLCDSKAEPAPAQDGREAFEASIQAEGGLIAGWGIGRKGDSYEYPPIASRYESFKAGAAWQRASPAQTEQQVLK